jgi:kinesin family protein 2/24
VLAVENLVELMKEAHNARSTGATGANAESSRSHLIMQIEIKKQGPISQSSRRVTNSFQRQFKEQAPKLVS